MIDTIGFMNEFISRVEVMEGINKIQFFGSILEPKRYRPGKSDLDVIIWGDPTTETKREITGIIIELNDKYKLLLSTSPYMHPTPFYLKNSVSEAAFNQFVLNMPFFIAWWRKDEKANPRLTLGEKWAGKEHPSILVNTIAEMLWG